VTRRDSGAGGFGGGGGGGGFGGGATGVIMQTGDYIFLTGPGSSPEGDRPFIDRLNLKTLQTERLFRSDAKSYETVVAPLDDEAKTILTRYETPTDPPNYYVRELATTAGVRDRI
jgi:dipeptidyl aminopeptidase/acylaminoacyl peptidase